MTTDSNVLALNAGLRAALGYYRLIAEIGRGGMANVFLALFPNGDGTSRQVVLSTANGTASSRLVVFVDDAVTAPRVLATSSNNTFYRGLALPPR